MFKVILASVFYMGVIFNVRDSLAQQVIDAGNTIVVPDDQAGPWIVNDNLVIADVDNGLLMIHNGSTVSNQSGIIGASAGSVGMVIVEGAGSAWMNSIGLVVGDNGNGVLAVSNGGKVSAPFIGSIGKGVEGVGIVAVEGGGSTLTTGRSDLYIGESGNGALSVSNGAAVSSGSGTLGVNAGSAGTVIIDGADSIWSNYRGLHVGYEGSGVLSVTNGGSVFSDLGFIGENASGTGKVIVNGLGSKLTLGAGDFGFDDFFVGNSGYGELVVSDGGAVSSGSGTIGMNSNSTGTVTVDGAASSWSNDRGLHVGYDGNGTLAITQGGIVSSDLGYIGQKAGSVGNVTVSGADSKLIFGAGPAGRGDFFVGDSGDGTLNVNNGGTISSGSGSIGLNAGSTGRVTVDGEGSSWSIGRELNVGYNGNGKLSITESGKVSSGFGTIGVGTGSNGILTLANDGELSLTGLNLAKDVGANGVVNIGAEMGNAAVAPGFLHANLLAFGGGTGVLNFNHTSTNYHFDTSLSGTGVITQKSGTTWLGGESPTLSGIVNIFGGTLGLANAQAIGNSDISMASNSTIDFRDSYTLTNRLTLADSPAINVNDGLTVVINGVISDAANASGGFIKSGTGNLALTGLNTYSGGTSLEAGRIDVSNQSALGSGYLSLNSDTTLGFAAANLTLANNLVLNTGLSSSIVDVGSFNGTLAGQILGSGSLTKNGSGTLTFLGGNTYSGDTDVTQGTLKAGAADTFSAASVHTVVSGATLDTSGFNQTIAGLTNNGTVSLLGAAPGSTLTVTGAYIGNGGTLSLGTLLGTSGVSDRLVLNGADASASGSTNIAITNLGGLGAQTIGNGIEVVTAQNGAITTSNAFSLLGAHVDAGAFEYRLFRADASGAGGSWYLRTDTLAPTTPTGPATPAYRAEVPVYSAQAEILRQSDLTMLSSLHKRRGDDMSTAVDQQVWARAIGGNLDIKQSGVAGADGHSNVSGLQVGVDLFANQNWKAGFYVGQLQTDSSVAGNVGSYRHAGSIRADGTYVAGYITYKDEAGLYSDSVVQYGRQGIDSKTSLTKSSNNANTWTASTELGKRYRMGSGWNIEPQAQLIYSYIDIDSASIAGARITQSAKNQVIGRLGIRVTGDFQTSVGPIQPYGRINVWHGFSGNDTSTFEGPAGSTDINSGIGYASTELATGLTLGLNANTSLYGEVGKMVKVGGSQSEVESDIQGTVGLKIRF